MQEEPRDTTGCDSENYNSAENSKHLKTGNTSNGCDSQEPLPAAGKERTRSAADNLSYLSMLSSQTWPFWGAVPCGALGTGWEAEERSASARCL